MTRVCISCDTMTHLFCRYYGRFCPLCGFLTVSIDGSAPQRFIQRLRSKSVSVDDLIEYKAWPRQTPSSLLMTTTATPPGTFFWISFGQSSMR
jgi:hypothetical protein